MRWFWHRCRFCGRKDGVLLTARKVWSYGHIVHRYHEPCYLDVLRHPTFHGHKKVDYALEIDECIAYANAEHKRRVKACAERMAALNEALDRQKEQASNDVAR